MENSCCPIAKGLMDCGNFEGRKGGSMYYYDSGQHIFDRALWGLVTVGKWLLRAIVYLPLWFCGYLLSTTFLQKDDSVWAWLASTVIIALALYQVLFFLKGLMIGMKMQKNAWWLVLFVVCCTFSCIAPAAIIYYLIEPIVFQWTTSAANIISALISIAFACWVYGRYHFLTNIAPLAAFPAYQLGMDCVSAMTRAEKSNRWI